VSHILTGFLPFGLAFTLSVVKSLANILPFPTPFIDYLLSLMLGPAANHYERREESSPLTSIFFLTSLTITA
jgi:hypothetical protein